MTGANPPSRATGTEDGPGTPPWRPSLWLRSLAHQAPATWPVGRSIRAAIGVGAPVVVASLMGDAVTGMWLAMGTLLLAAGERSVSYASRLRQIAIVTPVAALSYFFGMLSTLPPLVTVVVMTAVAFAGSVVSNYSGPVSVAAMQAMLIGAIAIGVEAAAPYWRPAVLFLAGALFYVVLLGVEMAVDRRRPERRALGELLRALADLSDGAAASSTDLGALRARALGAIDEFDRIALARRGTAQGPLAEYERAARISRAADQLLARLLAHDADPALSAAAAERLRDCADAVSRRRRPPPRAGAPGTLVRLVMLEDAIWEADVGRGGLSPTRSRTPRARLALPGPDLLAAAGVVGLCTALAYAAFFLLPLPHGYWIPLTVALVMKPDLGSVFGRAVLRSVGTVAGAVIAVVVGLLLHGAVGVGIAIAVLAACLPWAMARSYALQAVFLTPLVMILIDLVAPDASIVGLTWDRIVTTAIGGLIAVVAGYLIWPSARHPRLAARFEDALTALAQYARDVARGASATTVATARRAAYRRLSDTAANLQRTLSEPPPAGAEAWAWIPVVTAAERVADRITDTSASRVPGTTTPDGAVLSDLADELAVLRRRGSGDHARRAPAAPRSGEKTEDPALRELADELAELEPMLTRVHARPEGHRGQRAPDTLPP